MHGQSTANISRGGKFTRIVLLASPKNSVSFEKKIGKCGCHAFQIQSQNMWSRENDQRKSKILHICGYAFSVNDNFTVWTLYFIKFVRLLRCVTPVSVSSTRLQRCICTSVTQFRATHNTV